MQEGSYCTSPESSNTITTDSVGGNRPRPRITAGRPTRAVIYSQVVGKSSSQHGTENSSLLADKYTEQAPPASSLEHEPAEQGQPNVRHHHLHLLLLLRTRGISRSTSTMTTSAASITTSAPPATSVAAPATTAAAPATTTVLNTDTCSHSVHSKRSVVCVSSLNKTERVSL